MKKSIKFMMVMVVVAALLCSVFLTGCTSGTADTPAAEAPAADDAAAEAPAADDAAAEAPAADDQGTTAESAAVADLVAEASALSDMDAYAFFQTLGDKGLTADEIIQFFIDLPVSQANQQIYDLYNEEGFEMYGESYPVGETYDGYVWENGMGTEIVGPFSGNNLKLPFTDYVASVEPSEAIKIGFVFHGFNHPWLVNYADSGKWEMDKYPDKIEGTFLDGEFDDAKMAEQIDSLIAQGVDGIVVWPQTEAGTTASVQRIVDAGIPVVTVDRLSGCENVNTRVAGNFPANGAQCGMYLTWKLAQETGEQSIAGNMVMLRKPLGSTADAVRTGYMLKVLSYFPGINILQSYHDMDSREEAYVNAQSALSAYDNIDCFYGTGDHEALAALEAVNAANRMDSRENGEKMIFLSIDDSKEAIGNVRDGNIEVNTPYTPLVADIGVRVMLQIIAGNEMPKDVITPNIPMVTQGGDTIYGLTTQTPDTWYQYTFGPEVSS